MNSDYTALMHLADRRGRALLYLYGAGTTIVAALTLPALVVPGAGIAALALLWTALVLLGRRGATPYGLVPSLIVIGIVAAIAALSAWNLADPMNPGYASWYLGSSVFVLLMLVLRGRRAWGWLGFALLCAIAMVSTISTGQPALLLANELLRHAGTLFIVTLFATLYRRAGRVIEALQQRSVQRAAAEAATTAATHERATQSERLEMQARPALERLLDERPLTAEERTRMALLEAELRDGIRATGLSLPRIVSEVRAARERGLRVVLVDDRGGELDERETTAVEAALLAELTATAEGEVTARLSSIDSDEIATIVVAGPSSYRRLVVSSGGTEVTTLTEDADADADRDV